jgi:pimeloyl-ACP methyl ester carboxylesterase
VDYVLTVGESLPDELRERFDIVGFDSRGVGESAPVNCTDDLGPLLAVEWAPDDARERRALLAETERFVDACAKANGSLLPYLQTQRTARDMDRVRIALGEPRLTYLGYSYGSYLGAWYAEQFPEHVRALVLDGPLDPALDAEAVQVEQAVGFERSLNDFLSFCSLNASCAFHRDGRSADAYDALRERIGANPLEVETGGVTRSLNGTHFDIGVTGMLYGGRSSWNELADALDAADEGHGDDLLFQADLYTGREGEGSYDDTQEAFIAIGCADGPPVGDVDDMHRIEDVAAEAAPRLGRTIVNGSLPCALWPVPAPQPRALHATGAAPILVLGARKDPATPFRWARGLTSELESATLVAVRSSSHTSFDSGNVCVDDLVIRYLVDLEVPARGTRC